VADLTGPDLSAHRLTELAFTAADTPREVTSS
jgi:hypothetical protein